MKLAIPIAISATPKRLDTKLIAGGESPRYLTRRRKGCATSRPFTMFIARSTWARAWHRQAKRDAIVSGEYSNAIDRLSDDAIPVQMPKASALANNRPATTAASHRRQSNGGSVRT